MEVEWNLEKQKTIAGGEDRISTLPDSILHEILSFVYLKSAVQTCVLSKRWRYVWTSLPNLYFDFGQFSYLEPSPVEEDSDEANIPRFAHFVNQVLSRRDNDSNICRFYFAPEFCDDPSFASKCLGYAVRHNVEQLYVWAFSYPDHFEFPPCFINYGSLKVLKLVYRHDGMSLDTPLQLPALKTLHLSEFLDDSANFITETVGNCPNLEILILDELSLNYFNINAPQLRELELSYSIYGLAESPESEIVVSVPRLASFEFKGNVLPVFSPTSFPCLHHVYVDLRPRFHSNFFDPIVKERMPLNVINMLGQLREAKSVILSLSTLEVLAMDPDSLKSHPSPFHKLKHLKLLAGGRCRSLTLPLNVMIYLTQGSSCGNSLVVEFHWCGRKAVTMKNMTWLEEPED